MPGPNDSPQTSTRASAPWFRFSTWGLLVLVTTASLTLTAFVFMIRIRSLSWDAAFYNLRDWIDYDLPEGIVAFLGLVFTSGSCRLKPAARLIANIGFGGVAFFIFAYAIAILSISDNYCTATLRMAGTPSWIAVFDLTFRIARPVLWAMVVIAMFYGRDDNSKKQVGTNEYRCVTSSLQ